MNRMRISYSAVSQGRGTVLVSMASVAVLCLILCAGQLKSQQTGSADLYLFLNTVERVYCIPNGLTLARITRELPTQMSWFIGHAMRQQIPFVNQNPNLQPLFENLQNQIRDILSLSVRMYGSTQAYRPAYGDPVTPQSLWTGVVMGMQGAWDNQILANYRVPLGSMPLALQLRPTVGVQQSELNLLGIRPERGYVRNEPPPGGYTPPPPAGAPAPEAILGTWYNCNQSGCAQLEVQLQGTSPDGKAIYEGRIVNNEGDTGLCNWPRPDPARGPVVAFQVAFDTLEKTGLNEFAMRYKGNHSSLEGISPHRVWEPIGLHYFTGRGSYYPVLQSCMGANFHRDRQAR